MKGRPLLLSQTLFGFALTAVQAFLLWPLLRHSFRTRDIAGISPVGEAIWVTGGLGWLAYGVMSGAPALVLSGSLAFAGSLAILVLTRPSIPASPRKWAWVWATITAAGLVVPTLVFGLPGLSISLAVFGTVQFLPQIGESLSGIYSRSSAAGVNPVASALRGTYAFGWAVYASAWAMAGAATYDPPLVAWGLAGAAAFTLQAAHAALDKRVPRDAVPAAAH